MTILEREKSQPSLTTKLEAGPTRQEKGTLLSPEKAPLLNNTIVDNLSVSSKTNKVMVKRTYELRSRSSPTEPLD